MPHSSTRLVALIVAIIGFVVPIGSGTASAQEVPIVAWAVNGFGTTAAEAGAASDTYRIVVDGVAGAEPVTVAPGERVAIPGLTPGRSYEIGFESTSAGSTTAVSPVTITPRTNATIDVAVHPAASGAPTVTAFANGIGASDTETSLSLRHVAATGPIEFQLFAGGGESGAALSPVGSPVTIANASQTVYGSVLTAGAPYTVEARLPSGARSRTSFTAGGEVPGTNDVVYLTGLNVISGNVAGGESGPFITPVIDVSGGGEGGIVPLNVINGFGPGAIEGANSYTVLLNGVPAGSEGGTVVAPGERIGVPQAIGGNTIEVGFSDGVTEYSAGDVAIPESGSVDVAIHPDPAGAPATAVFSNATDVPSSASAVLLRNISQSATADLSVVEGATEGGAGGTPVSPAVSVANGEERPYGSDLASGPVLYSPRVTVGAQTSTGERFIVGSETNSSGVRAVYAIGNDFGASGEASAARSFRVFAGPSNNPLSVVNGFGTGQTETANSFNVVIDGVAVTGEAIGPRSRALVTSPVERGTTVTVQLVEPGTSNVRATQDVTIPDTGSVDVVVAPDQTGDIRTGVITNGVAPSSGTTLDVRHAAGLGSVDVVLYEGGGESGTPLTVVAGPVSVDPLTSVQLATGLDANLAYEIEVRLANGTVLSTPFTPGGDGASALQAAYLVGIGGGGTQTNALTIIANVPPGTGFGITSQAPQRVVDTRGAGETVDGVAAGGGQVRAGQFREFQVAGRGGVPDGSAAVVANVTAARGAGVGFLTVYPCGERPNASTLNYVADTPIANASVLPLSESGSLCVYSSRDADVIIDVTGFVPAGSAVG